jgi:hypothetical protein
VSDTPARNAISDLVRTTGRTLGWICTMVGRAEVLHEEYVVLLYHDPWEVCACPLARVLRSIRGTDLPAPLQKRIDKEARRFERVRATGAAQEVEKQAAPCG